MASALRYLTKVLPNVRISIQKNLSGVSVDLFRRHSTAKKNDVDHYTSKDGLLESNQQRPEDGGMSAVDPTNRAFTYSVLGTSRFIYAAMARMTVVKVVSTLNIGRADAALALTEVETNSIKPGETLSVKWRGAPAFVKRRTPEEIASSQAYNWKTLRDPQSDEERVHGNDPQWVVVMANCTHLGCIPIANAGNYEGFFCPCHGSHYDNCGRIRQGPAPLNLHNPDFSVKGDLLIIG